MRMNNCTLFECSLYYSGKNGVYLVGKPPVVRISQMSEMSNSFDRASHLSSVLSIERVVSVLDVLVNPSHFSTSGIVACMRVGMCHDAVCVLGFDADAISTGVKSKLTEVFLVRLRVKLLVFRHNLVANSARRIAVNVPCLPLRLWYKAFSSVCKAVSPKTESGLSQSMGCCVSAKQSLMQAMSRTRHSSLRDAVVPMVLAQ